MNKKYRYKRYFFLDDELVKMLWVNRPGDLVEVWNFVHNKRIRLPYRQFRRDRKKAYTTREVSALINRTRMMIETYILDGKIPKPQRSYVLGHPERKGWLYWSDNDILGLHEYLMTIHHGRPRADGKITPMSKTPSRAELIAMLRNETVTYVKTKTGEFVPAWKELNY